MNDISVNRRPSWLKVELTGKGDSYQVRQLLKRLRLHTVCESARCPNIGECWGRRTAAFMILGDVCTRNCAFCAISHGKPKKPDVEEPQRVAQAVKHLGLSYAVVTSVTRDDLPDGGAGQFAQTIRAIRAINPDCKVEVLIPDFAGSAAALQVVLNEKPDVLNHNIETVPALYPYIRPQADFSRSLQLLRRAARAGMTSKSGLMLGLGETIDEVRDTMHALLDGGCQILTLGQYLPPSRKHFSEKRFVTPAEFHDLKMYGEELGFRHVESAPLVRSSYHADEQVNKYEEVKKVNGNIASC
ncbi:lipoyl synthase [candidate division KSB1 bacterium]|nr:lipoyl synthase [candidate division KSB1 bacterium]